MNNTEESKDVFAQQAAKLTQHLATVPKSTQGVYELPCGYLDEHGELHREVALREIKGGEEDLLANPKVAPFHKVNELLTRCVERIGTILDRERIGRAVLDLVAGDRTFIMFAIRRLSLGDDYPFRDKCPECSKENLFVVDLSTLEPKIIADPRIRAFEKVLPSAKTARFHTMSGRDEQRLSKLEKNAADVMSLAIMMRLDSLDGKAPSLEDVKDLGLRDRNYLRDQFREIEGGLDTEIELVCPNAECGAEFKREVDVTQAGFFFPSAIRKNSKPKSST